MEFQTANHMREMFDVNIFGAWEMTASFMPLLKKSHGRVVNISSIAGAVGMPNIVAYSASKAAVLGFSESLR